MDTPRRKPYAAARELAELRCRVAELEAAEEERRRAAEALHYSEELRRTLVERSDDIIFVIDAEDRVRYVNPAAAALHGCPPEDVIGRRRADLFPPEVSRQQTESLRKVFESGQAHSRDSWIVYPSGRLWVNTRLVPLRDAAGRVTMVLGISRDLSEHKKIEDALRDSEASYRAIFDAANDGIFVHDIATGEIVDVNPRMCEMYGYAREEILGKLPGAFSSGEPPFTQENARARFRAAAAGVPQFFEWRVRSKAGEAFWVEVSLKKAPIGGRERVLAAVSDIRGRKRAEDALRDSEERYRAIFEQAADSVLLLDTETGAILDFNDRAHESLGYTREEFSALSLGQIDAIESPDEAVQHCAKIVREGADAFETKQLTKSGEVRDVQVRARRISIRGRDYVLGVWHDITERKRAEEARRESEERYRGVFNTAPLAFVVWDGHCRVVDWNAGAERMFGWTRSEVLGRDFFDVIIPPRARSHVQEVVTLLLQGRVPSRSVNENITKDGRLLLCEWNNSVIHDAQGCVRYGMSLGLDITEARRAHDALRLSERQYRSTLDSLGDSMHVMDRDFRIVLFNQSFRDWVESLGLEAAIEGRTVFEAFPFLPEQVRDEYRRVFEAGTTLITEETTRVGARDIITETRKIPVFEGERVARIITVVRDITDRRRMEQQLLKTQKLESIGLLAGGIAHDFNNLLAGVLTNLAVARAKASGDSSLGRALAEAERAAYRARGLTQRLLAFSGGSEPIRRPLALGPLVRETVEFALAGSDVRSSLAVPDNLWPVHADAQQIGQVLQNLVLNARQAMPDGGTVAIVAENVLVGPGGPLQLAPGRFVRISVVDHGVGIPAEHVPRIFDPFFTTKEGGGGLGLASSFATVKKHGGAIEFQSQPGVGTTFHVYLPASNAPAAPPPGPSGEPGRPAARILLMEDDTILRRGARRLLRQSGYEVECARDGAEAVALYGQAMQAGHPFDAVILDLVVSEGMGGEECARGLRALDPGVKAIACTGYAEDDVFACLREQGFRAFLRKPFTPEELAEALRRVAAADA